MKLRFTFLLAFFLPFVVHSQCTTTNATSCQCLVTGQTNCDLVPDLTISGWAMQNYMAGPNEYPQVCTPACSGNDGRLRLSGSTPNIGRGSFTVGAVNQWVCGVDTFTSYAAAQAAGCPNAKQLVKQKIYHKNGSTMTYTERWAGTMTYHSGHGHMHVDDWVTFTLRIEDPNDPNPLNWPIVGNGGKLGFCLMDYGSCNTYNGHCRDSLGNVLTGPNFPNYGLGGGAYNCSPTEQGISSGWTDIYSENLDGMWVNIPPGTCNGDYYIVGLVDPNTNFIEEKEWNNWCAIPFTLTQQVPSGSFVANVTAAGPTTICAGGSVTLTATQGNSYAWSTGATTQSITVSASGTYVCTVTAPCGNDASDPVVVTVSNTATAPATTGDAVCPNNIATLTATGTGTFDWYDALTGGTLLGSGPTFTTPVLTATTNYYVERLESTPGQTYNLGPVNGSIGTGAMHATNTRYLEFNATQPFTLQSVWVNAGSAGNRTFEIRNSSNAVLATTTQYVAAGQGRVTLNLAVPIGTGLRLGLNTSSTADMYRNNGGVTYPYTVANVASITGSDAGSQYYYFFYDWDIKTADFVCATPRATVTAVVNPNPTVSFSGLQAMYNSNDPASTLVGNPPGGTFSGPGVSGNSFDPVMAGLGTHTITYTYTDGNGCTGSTTMSTTVNNTVGVIGSMFAVVPSIYPNPHGGHFTLSFSIAGTHNTSIELFTVTGQSAMKLDLGQYTGAYVREFDISKMARGIYFLELKVDDQKMRSKVVFQ